MALIRFLVIALFFLSLLYVSLWFYLRARRAELLEAEWDETEHGAKDAWIDDQMAGYNARRSRLLLWLVYVLPLCSVVLIVYLTNYH